MTDPLLDNLDRPRPPAWRPTEAGATLIGTFVRLERGETSRGPARIAIIENDTGAERAVWILHKVLRDELARLRPQPGQRLALRYEGKKVGQGGVEYHGWKVAAEAPTGAVDWDDDEPADSEGGEW